MPKKIEMSYGALEGLAASSARGPTGFVSALHRFLFEWSYGFTPQKISVTLSSSLKDSAKGEYIEGRVLYALSVQHAVTSFISFEYPSCQ